MGRNILLRDVTPQTTVVNILPADRHRASVGIVHERLDCIPRHGLVAELTGKPTLEVVVFGPGGNLLVTHVVTSELQTWVLAPADQAYEA